MTNKQIAEKLARSCVDKIDTLIMNNPNACSQEEAISSLANVVLQTIPLAELMEIRDAYERVWIDSDTNDRERDRLLNNLNEKIRKIIGE